MASLSKSALTCVRVYLCVCVAWQACACSWPICTRIMLDHVIAECVDICIWVCGGAGLCVFMADVYMEAPSGDEDQRPHELHRFLVHCPDGRRLESVAEKRQALLSCCKLCGNCAAPHTVPGGLLPCCFAAHLRGDPLTTCEG